MAAHDILKQSLEGLILSNESDFDSSLFFVVNTQQEFWQREFQGTIIEKDENYKDFLEDLISRGIRPIFQVDQDPSELEFLSSLPVESIIVWCHFDESYDLDFNKSLSMIDSIYLILRPYRLPNFSFGNLFKSIFKTILNLKYARNIKFVIKVILWQLRGFSMQIRQIKIQHFYKKRNRKYRNILIGYTNIFAISLLESGRFSNSKSLSSLFQLIAEQENKLGPIPVTFSGQVGQVIRETAINAISRVPDALIIRRSTYGASNVLEGDVKTKGSEYVEVLQSSKFVLCPPGNISGESFRIFETVLMRRVPIVMESVTSDPNYKVPFKFKGNWQYRQTWGGMMSEALQAQPEELEAIVSANFENYRNEIEATRLFLAEISHR